MRRSLFFRTFAGYIVIALVLSTTTLLVSYHAIRSSYRTTYTRELTELCTLVQPQVTELLAAHDLKALSSVVKHFTTQTHKRLTIIALDGTVLADSENDPATMSNHRTRPEVAAALAGETGSALRYSSTLREEMLYIALPMRDSNRQVGVVRCSMLLREINALLKNIMFRIAGTAAVTLLMALGIALAFARSLAIPLARIAAASRKLAAGDFSAKVAVTTNTELQDLAAHFNHMADRIQALFSDLSRQKDELRVIINSITDELFVIDRQDTLLLCNESFRRLAPGRELIGLSYWEVLRAPRLVSLIDRVKHHAAAVYDEIEREGNIFAASAVPTPAGDAYVVVLHDITEIKNLEKKKKELVANVSHELRTPLTAIKGFAETLEDETTPAGRRYLDIIKKHVERLISIVQDLLMLAQAEEKGFNIQIAATRIEDIIASAVKLFAAKASAKKLSLVFSPPDALAPIPGDPFLLEQVFVNLIDNAIAYTDAGNITISIQQDQQQTVISVADTGIGIAADQVPYIFERFYVVDKSRSRKSGGTGLGLSIVKHIVLLHQGSITVDSAIAVGTRVTVTLPSR
jgi:two-component system phosphate regulon sensor histidine kinase PhoR